MKAKTRPLIIPIIPLTIPRGLLRQKDLPRSHYQRDVEPGSKVRLVALRPDHFPPTERCSLGQGPATPYPNQKLQR